MGMGGGSSADATNEGNKTDQIKNKKQTKRVSKGVVEQESGPSLNIKARNNLKTKVSVLE